MLGIFVFSLCTNQSRTAQIKQPNEQYGYLIRAMKFHATTDWHCGRGHQDSRGQNLFVSNPNNLDLTLGGSRKQKIPIRANHMPESSSEGIQLVDAGRQKLQDKRLANWRLVIQQRQDDNVKGKKGLKTAEASFEQHF